VNQFHEPLSKLSFDRTVPRDLVHRRNLSELFLTDSARVDDTHFVAGAQLPAAHPYYTDHVGVAAAVDPLLVLECCRQAETHAVHEHYGAPADTKFILRSWRVRMAETGAVAHCGGPHEIALAATTSSAQWRGDVLRGQRYAIEIFLGANTIGEAWMDVAYMPGDVYDALRSRSRKTAPPSSDDFREPAPAGVPAARVGRSDSGNVLLQSPNVEGERLHAGMRVLGGHPSLFDHAQDHLPGMVLMEAGRQMSVMASEHFTGITPSDAAVIGLDASFSAYAELDAGTTLTASAPQTTEDGVQTICVTFDQHGETIAETSFAIRPAVGTRGAGRRSPQRRARRPRTAERAAVISGLGAWTPPRAVTNDMLAAELDTSDEWIRSRTGIGQRHIVSPGMSTSDVAIEAGGRALESARRGEQPSGPAGRPVDAVVLATSTPDRSCPATAPLVASRLGLRGVAAFDVAAVCTGFLYALATAAGLLSAEVAEAVLVIGADTFSTILNPADRATRVIFGDGAGAVVLRAGQHGEPGALLGFDLGSDGDGGELITVPGGGSEQRSRGVPAAQHDHYFQMDGKPVFARAVRRMTDSTNATIATAGWRPDQVDHLVAHQANIRILNACARELGMPPERIVSNLDRVGNTVAASIPLALADAARSGELTAGERVVLTGFGGGLTWGSTALTWPQIAVQSRHATTDDNTPAKEHR
jgi:3-oxoacyl-[acyl-carrier-protein] synthase-3